MWSGLWDTFEKVTKKAVQFYFIHGTGLKAILIDGCKPQVDACGDDLIERIRRYVRNHPDISQDPEWMVIMNETDPQVIVQWIVRTCTVHLDRYG
jgi:hypothetical protein